MIYFMVVDCFGNVVFYMIMIEQLFGFGIMVFGYGVVLNNELIDFDVVLGGVNEVQLNKCLFSSMILIILFKNNEFVLIVGFFGGVMIIFFVL